MFLPCCLLHFMLVAGAEIILPKGPEQEKDDAWKLHLIFHFILPPVLLILSLAPGASTLLVPQARLLSRTTKLKYMARPVRTP